MIACRHRPRQARPLARMSTVVRCQATCVRLPDGHRDTANVISKTLTLATGMAIGLAAALTPHLRANTHLPAGVAASVNGQPILQRQWDQATAALAQDQRGTGNADQALQRLIEEELLLQYALEQNLVRLDRDIKARLVNAVLDQIRQQAAARPVSAADIADYLASNPKDFTPEHRYRARVLRFRGAEAASRARQAQQSWHPDTPVTNLDADQDLPLPEAALPAHKLTDYLGPSLRDALLALEPGQAGKPLQLGQAWHVPILLARDTVALPAVQREALARAAIRRLRAEQALQRRLADLSRRYQVRTRSGGDD